MAKDKKIELFESVPVPKAVITLSVPTIISSLVALLYSLADTYFVGMLNDPIQTAAVTLAAPVLLALGTLWCAKFGRDSKGVVHGVLPQFKAGTFTGPLGFSLLVGFVLITMYTGESPFIYFQF